VTESFNLSNGKEGNSEIILDYECAGGGLPFIGTSSVLSNGGVVEIDIIFSKIFAGLQSETSTPQTPTTYAFYCLSYALLLIVAIKDYRMHSGDVDIMLSV
jgi:hypothetical protein